MSEPRQLLDCPDRSNLGRRLTLEPGAPFQALLDVRGEDAAARAVTVTVTLAPTIQVDALGPDDILANRDELRARALIEAGVGGHVAKLEIDVGAGVQFGASVSSLRVSAINDGGAPIDVGAFVGYGTTPSRPTLTVVGAALGFRANWVLAVPAFARTVEVLRPPEHELLVDVGLGRAGDRWLYGDRVFLDERMTPLPLANGCRRVRITSLATGRSFRPVVLFSLAL
jgi:hypothetical protein